MNPKDIEFRVYDKRKNRMSTVFQLDFSTGTVYYDKYDLGKMKDIPIMQYTGLKDKNRQKIFEGDIVQVDTSEKLLTVEFCTHSFSWKLVSNNGEDMVYLGDHKTIEIVGNIYEGITSLFGYVD